MRLVSQLTSAALVASSPVLPSSQTMSPILIRPLAVPKLQITLANNNIEIQNNNQIGIVSDAQACSGPVESKEKYPAIKPRLKKKNTNVH